MEPDYFLRNARVQTVSSTSYRFDARERQPRSDSIYLLFQCTQSGAGMLEYGGRKIRVTRELPAGTGFLGLVPGSHRHWFPGGQRPWEFVYVSIRLPRPATPMARWLGEIGPWHAFPLDGALVRLATEQATILAQRGWIVDRYTRGTMAYRFLMELQRHFDPQAAAPSPFPDLAKALEFIERHLADKISLRDIASSAGLSPSSVVRAFRQRLNTTPAQFLIGQRIERARNLLVETALPLKSIAWEAGFATERYFCHCFRERTGLTPGAYRRQGATRPFLDAADSRDSREFEAPASTPVSHTTARSWRS